MAVASVAPIEFVLTDERKERAVCLPLDRVVVTVGGSWPPAMNRVLAAAAASGVMVNRVTATPRTFTLTAPSNSACLRNALEQVWLAASPPDGPPFAMPVAGERPVSQVVMSCAEKDADGPDPEALCGAAISAREVLGDLTRSIAYGRTLRVMCAHCVERRAGTA